MGVPFFPILITISLLKWSQQDKVEQLNSEISVKEGSNVTLTCSLETNDSSPYVYWYSQQPGKAPVYMFQLIGENVQRNTGLDDRISSKFDRKNKTTELTISNALISDNAVYLCAMKPTLLQRHSESCTKTLHRQFQVMSSRVRSQTRGQFSFRSESDRKIIHIATEHNTQKQQLDIVEEILFHRHRLQSPSLNGDIVQLFCNYTATSTSTPYLFWYRQYSNGFMKFLLRRDRDSGNTETSPGDRFTAELNDTIRTVPLKVSKTELEDSDLYYCALSPTETQTWAEPVQKLSGPHAT